MKTNEHQHQENAAVAADAPAAQQDETAAAQQPAQNEEPAQDADSEIAAADDVSTSQHLNVSTSQRLNVSDPSYVPVTILVLATSVANNYLLLRHCLRSLRKNLRGVNAQVRVVGKERPDWLDCETWLSDAAGEYNHLNELVALALPFCETERIILMTDRMHLVRPVTLADISLLKALPENNGNKTVARLASLPNAAKYQLWNYLTHMPLYAFRTTLMEVLQFLADIGQQDLHLPTVYNNLLYYDVRPTLLNWNTDSWLLPLVSAHPSMNRMEPFLRHKKFLWISPNSEGAEEVVAILKFLTPDATTAENDVPNADPA